MVEIENEVEQQTVNTLPIMDSQGQTMTNIWNLSQIAEAILKN